MRAYQTRFDAIKPPTQARNQKEALESRVPLKFTVAQGWLPKPQTQNKGSIAQVDGAIGRAAYGALQTRTSKD